MKTLLTLGVGVCLGWVLCFVDGIIASKTIGSGTRKLDGTDRFDVLSTEDDDPFEDVYRETTLEEWADVGLWVHDCEIEGRTVVAPVGACPECGVSA